MIPLNDLTKQPPEVMGAVSRVVRSGRYVKGPFVDEFEEAWAKRCGMQYAIGVSSGAMALELAIRVLFYDRGDCGEISYTKKTFKAVPNAIVRMGFRPISMDDNISVPSIFAHHLHDSFLRFPAMLEDCSHAHGIKPISDTAIFSFFPTKIFGACGDAGIIVTNDINVADPLYYIRSHTKFAQFEATNARMDEIQAAVLLAKLPYLDSWITRRKEIVDLYDKAFDRKTPGQFHYAYCIEGSEEKRQKLEAMGIESRFYYTEQYMALPLHPYLTNLEVEEVIHAVKSL